MQDQIKDWAARFGVSTEQIEAGLGAIFQFIRNKVPDAQWEQLQALVPQIQHWIGEAATLPGDAKQAAGGMASGLMGQAAGLLDKLGGGAHDGLATLTSQLQAVGLKAEVIPQFAAEVLGQIKAKVGGDRFKGLLAAVPGLDTLTSAGAGLLGKLRNQG